MWGLKGDLGLEDEDWPSDKENNWINELTKERTNECKTVKNRENETKDKWTNKQTNEQMNENKKEMMRGKTKMNFWTILKINKKRRNERWMNIKESKINERTEDEWMNERASH